ncbi:MAG TPA: bifunctional pyr operon transcriptional regulator/uracil phosphoribosyltransferase PyrR [Pseudonocardia sp.]|uniref:bifunctional pyr operon transcriptional regulator/uracil phosphoribosyltransferase PyrR n=1 Tax=Pseudonocardia sp. TaxID=60912 RepID=UPI002D0B42A1|nr:bifunctional pyr operon transcriptional regulator/uracil phosphoribosyltransferase PyrR [Pseudonocardia sp.]HTF49957.1 bifunctional pyr operon transcriptional regulator/uracil phosphoribosyltransferase PyrR [Pseudonocardia sp.]
MASPRRARGDQPAGDRQSGAKNTELLTESDVARTVARIAHQIIEKTAYEPAQADQVVLLGLPTRGATLARRLGAAIAEFAGAAPSVGTLDATLYRDDLRRRPARSLEPTSIPDGGVDDKLVILVDDVLFSGRTARAALDALRDHGRPRAVQLAVLVDRGHRELPIRADYVGKNVPTSRGEQVAVLLSEVDGRDAVLLRRAGEDPHPEAHPEARHVSHPDSVADGGHE